MKKRAVWIIDEGFLVPALVSVRSFLSVLEMPITILFCGEAGLLAARNAFGEIEGDITIDTWQGELPNIRPEFARTIRNRLARMEAMSSSKDELLLMLDADIVFAPGMEELVLEIEAKHPTEPSIWGVPDQSVAWQNQFYFHLFDEMGRKQRLHPGEQREHYRNVFGPEWRHLLGSHGFNNGMLAVYNCQEAAHGWRDYYLRGLKNPKINPEDDQRPLAAALKASQTQMHILPDRYNSRGEMMGNYVAFHAITGRWRMPFRAMEMGLEPNTDFGQLAARFWKCVPEELRNGFLKYQEELIPYRFHALSGPHGFWPIYRSAVKMFTTGHFVEVGTQEGKGTCFMTESIQLSGKKIEFDSITCKDRFPNSFDIASENLEKVRLQELTSIYDLSSKEGAKIYKDETLDLVALYGATSTDELLQDLKAWYPKIKKGGMLAGLDLSIQNGLGFGLKSPLTSFCDANGIICRANGKQFIIEKKGIAKERSLVAAVANRAWKGGGGDD